jgi:hypothetical protein
MKSPACIDVDSIGLSESTFLIFTKPCIFLKYIPAAQSLRDVLFSEIIEAELTSPDDAGFFRSIIEAACPFDAEYIFSEIMVYMVPGGRGALLATKIKLVLLSRIISAALRALRSR